MREKERERERVGYRGREREKVNVRDVMNGKANFMGAEEGATQVAFAG